VSLTQIEHFGPLGTGNIKLRREKKKKREKEGKKRECGRCPGDGINIGKGNCEGHLACA